MTHLMNPDSVEKEARLQDAITVVLNGEKTLYRAILHFNVLEQTLYD